MEAQNFTQYIKRESNREWSNIELMNMKKIVSKPQASSLMTPSQKTNKAFVIVGEIVKNYELMMTIHLPQKEETRAKIKELETIFQAQKDVFTHNAVLLKGVYTLTDNQKLSLKKTSWDLLKSGIFSNDSLSTYIKTLHPKNDESDLQAMHQILIFIQTAYLYSVKMDGVKEITIPKEFNDAIVLTAEKLGKTRFLTYQDYVIGNRGEETRKVDDLIQRLKDPTVSDQMLTDQIVDIFSAKGGQKSNLVRYNFFEAPLTENEVSGSPRKLQEAAFISAHMPLDIIALDVIKTVKEVLAIMSTNGWKEDESTLNTIAMHLETCAKDLGALVRCFHVIKNGLEILTFQGFRQFLAPISLDVLVKSEDGTIIDATQRGETGGQSPSLRALRPLFVETSTNLSDAIELFGLQGCPIEQVKKTHEHVITTESDFIYTYQEDLRSPFLQLLEHNGFFFNQLKDLDHPIILKPILECLNGLLKFAERHRSVALTYTREPDEKSEGAKIDPQSQVSSGCPHSGAKVTSASGCLFSGDQNSQTIIAGISATSVDQVTSAVERAKGLPMAMIGELTLKGISDKEALEGAHLIQCLNEDPANIQLGTGRSDMDAYFTIRMCTLLKQMKYVAERIDFLNDKSAFDLTLAACVVS